MERLRLPRCCLQVVGCLVAVLAAIGTLAAQTKQYVWSDIDCR